MRALRAALLLLCTAQAWAVPAFVKEDGVRLSSAVLQGMTGAYTDGGGGARFFYVRGSTEVFSARSADGLALAEESGVRVSSLTAPAVDIALSSITGLALLPLDAGGFRMAYSVIGTTGSYRIYTATSADGLAWANSTGTAVDGGTSFVGSPSLVELASGEWQLFWVQDFNGGAQASDFRIFSALSTNEGRNFGAGAVLLSTQAGQVAATKLTDGRVRLYYTTPLPAGTSTHLILSAVSANSNATSFAFESGLRLSTSASVGTLSSPFVARSTDSYRWRLYYRFEQPLASTGSIYSAANFAPDPQSVSPSVVFNTNADAQIAITGEAFSDGAIAARLSRLGQADIPGTGLTRTNDQTLSANFNINNVATGFWNLTVTNSNGQATTLSDGVLVDFPGGSIVVTDNLFRPRQGGRARIDATLFAGGQLTLRLYTLEGGLVATLFDGPVPVGTHSYFWDGKTAQGRTVASGVYVLQANGPKLNNRNKIVVIK